MADDYETKGMDFSDVPEVAPIYAAEVHTEKFGTIYVLCQPVAVVGTGQPDTDRGTHYHLKRRFDRALGRGGARQEGAEDLGEAGLEGTGRAPDRTVPALPVKDPIDSGGGSIIAFGGIGWGGIGK